MDASRLRFLSLWAINGDLDTDRLKRQLKELKDTGLEGIVFHSRFYPGNPPYMSDTYLDIVSDLILYARELNMEFWIYDENGWPSGTAGGQVIARLPDSRCEWIEWRSGADGIGEIVLLSKPAVSSFDRRATETFIALTHERYRDGLHAEAFDYVTGFFTDEVGFLDGHGVSVSKGGIPWHSSLPEAYRIRHDEALAPLLPLLFESGEDSGVVRARYWELLTEALVEGFYSRSRLGARRTASCSPAISVFSALLQRLLLSGA
ncbi:hypothetical protein [Cohnella sp. GbtcB17]|uniref:hypothetical protein n=1 Tax=Cohnella sp. GbtcB17 TaxID=2824762 RepID=UPI001C30C157|nr:hypothetical protein [Cohnella sp. GbtcB17]